MKNLVGTALLLATTASLACADEIRTCDFEIKSRCASGQASVTLADKVVKKIAVDVIWCGQGGGPGYTCTIDSSRDDKDSRWSDDGQATVIANTQPSNPAAPDRVKVTVGRFVSIDLDEAQSIGRCGAGAELPRAIVIPSKKGACRVWLRAP
jgi:hypothetical protein